MKKAYFYIDDTIWVLRDITRQRPKSLFDNPFMKMLKNAHDRYGVKTQLNLFYRTDYFYGNDEFTLADVTDAYKAEFQAASSWLKMAFHAKQEFPDYPHVNATYDDIHDIFKNIEKEVIRFAGKDSFAYSTCTHWLPVSKEGVRALKDCGVKILDSTYGEKFDNEGNFDFLPYGHSFRFLNNHQKDTMTYWAIDRRTGNKWYSIGGYNHLTIEEHQSTYGTTKHIYNEETKLPFKKFATSCLNTTPYDKLEDLFSPQLDNEYIGIVDHEQYFYSDYFAYQPDYAEKIYKMGELLTKHGFEFICGEELLDK